MIRNHPLLAEFERRDTARRAGGHRAAFRLFDAMVREAVALGMLPLADPLEGIEVDIELSRKLKRVRGTPPAD
jgi:hypothetical protein